MGSYRCVPASIIDGWPEGNSGVTSGLFFCWELYGFFKIGGLNVASRLELVKSNAFVFQVGYSGGSGYGVPMSCVEFHNWLCRISMPFNTFDHVSC